MPAQTDQLWPCVALAAFTIVVLIHLALARIGATLTGRVKPGDFAFGEAAGLPERIILANRNYMNLLELPVLFYVACIILYAARLATPATVALGWSYVAFRALHSLIHLTYNRVTHRLLAFATSNTLLAALWCILAIRLAQTTAI